MNTCPIFVNYYNAEDDDPEVKYMEIDQFPKQIFLNSVQLNNGEGKDFYYLGEVTVDSTSVQNDILIDKEKSYNVALQ